MQTIKSYIVAELENVTSQELANRLGISLSMLSAYKKSYNPSLEVAKRVYLLSSIALHPFSEKALKYELGDKK